MPAKKNETTNDTTKRPAAVADELEELEDYEEESTGSRLVKIAIILFLLLAFIIGGFALGLYFKLYDMEQINEKLKLYDYPVTSWFFDKPLSVIEEEDRIAMEKAVEEAQAAEQEKKAAEDAKKAAAEQETLKLKEAQDAANGIEKPKTLTKEELDKQVKARQAEEKKRISKLARLYNNMNPEEAVTIMNDLDDDIVIDILNKMDEAKVAKILNAFEENRGARLTRIMYTGKPNVSHVR